MTSRVCMEAWRDGQARMVEDVVVREGDVRIFWADETEPRRAFVCSPNRWTELAVGCAIGEGWIKPPGALFVSLNLRDENSCDVRLGPLRDETGEAESVCLNPPACSRRQDLPDRSTIFAAMAELERKARIFQLTGGTHAAAALLESGELGPVIEDISRHAAVDKVIGRSAMAPSLSPLLALVVTCRVSSSIVEKAARAGVPILLARGAPSDRAIRLARASDVTLVGFLRGDRMNVYHRRRTDR